MKPKISVILSVYNQAEYLPRCISSILKQTFKDFEFIIINDASTDSSLRYLQNLKDKRLQLVSHHHRQGLAGSLNQAIGQSRGDFIARMDADDIAHKNRLKIQFDYLNQHPQVAACGTAANLIDNQGKIIGQKHYPINITKPILIRFNPLIHPTAMIRRKFCDYDVNLDGAEDYDLWLRLGSNHQLANIDQVLLDYRVNPEGISWKTLKLTELQAIKARFKALKDYNYPKWQAIFLIKPILSYLIPSWVKKLLFNIR